MTTKFAVSLTLVFFFVCSSFAAPTPNASVYDDFLKCFNKQTNTTPSGLSDVVYSPSNPSFTPVLRAYIRNARFNTSTSPKPAVIITPQVYAHVGAAVVCARTLNFQIKIRSGGHDYEGISYVSPVPFFILDLSNLRNVTVDLADAGGSAWVEAGATLGEIYYRISEKSKVHGFPAGVCPTVGAGGHISGGGYGNMIRKFGLSVDYVVDAKIVDVKGRILDRKSMGEDLFWAIRGGGGASFGVILAFKIKLVSVPQTVTVFRKGKYLNENATEMVHKWQFVAPRTDPGLFMRLLLQPVTQSKTRSVRATVMALYLGNANDVVSLLTKEFPELGLQKEDCHEMTWIQSVLYWANHENATEVKPEVLLDREPDSASFGKRKSDYVQTAIAKPDLDWIFRKMIEVGKTGFVFNPYGGNLNLTGVTETPFPHRNMLFKMQYSVNWEDPSPALAADYLRQARSMYGYMSRFVTANPRRAYVNYRDLEIGTNTHTRDSYRQGEIYGRKYFAENFDRLVKVKSQIDPENYFWNEQSIPAMPIKA